MANVKKIFILLSINIAFTSIWLKQDFFKKKSRFFLCYWKEICFCWPGSCSGHTCTFHCLVVLVRTYCGKSRDTALFGLEEMTTCIGNKHKETIIIRKQYCSDDIILCIKINILEKRIFGLQNGINIKIQWWPMLYCDYISGPERQSSSPFITMKTQWATLDQFLISDISEFVLLKRLSLKL